MRITPRCLALVLLLPAGAHGQTASPPPDLDRYVASVLREFQVPGVSLAIVQDGKVVLAQGYGVGTLGDTARVTPRTLFGIASNTKAFTATALGLLVEEGKLDWDAPVVSYLPAFAMYDPFVTRELTIKDLLVHRSGLGLGAGDLLWWPPSTYSRKEIAHRLRYLKPATSFRSAYIRLTCLFASEIACVTGPMLDLHFCWWLSRDQWRSRSAPCAPATLLPKRAGSGRSAATWVPRWAWMIRDT